MEKEIMQIRSVDTKKKVLREELKRELNTVSDDWTMHLIVEALAGLFHVDLSYVLRGVRDEDAINVDCGYAKGSIVDKDTKNLAKMYYVNEALLRNFVSAVDKVLGSANGKPVLLSLNDAMSTSVEGDRAVIRLSNCVNNAHLFETVSIDDYLVIVGDAGLQGEDSVFDTLAVRLLEGVATRYGYRVFATKVYSIPTEAEDDEDYEESAVDLAFHKLK